LDLGLRSGYSLPFGSGGYNADDSLSDAIKGALPLWLDVGYADPVDTSVFGLRSAE
jgi:hypothetical protein